MFFYKILINIFLTLFLLTNLSFAKTVTFRVFFKDKGPEQFSPGTDLYNQTLKTLTQRAINRRLKVRNENNLITIEDAPVYQGYIDKVLESNVKLLLKLKWRNYCVFSCDSIEYEKIYNEVDNLPFVREVQKTGELIPVPQNILDTAGKKRKFNKSDLYTLTSYEKCGSISYGESYNQVHIINADKLHKLGITGDSVLLGILDAGFRWRTHNSMKNANVIAEYDFIQLDSNTSNEKDDVKNQDAHGTLVFSTISGFLPDKLIGISPTSSFILCKTESIPKEIHLEEDNYAAAIEWLEAMGADISTSSLAYKTFDEGDDNYEFDNDFNGKSTITAIALNNAVARGMVCLTAAGNTGPEAGTILTPGDADSVITCAAVKFVNNDLVPANFSSRGPRPDSVIKPDIAALGVQVVSAGRKDSVDLIKANGTSLSTPLIAGATSLLLSCFPELKPWEVRNLLYSTASNYPEKDNTWGYGVLDIWAAAQKAGTIISPPVIYSLKDYVRIIFHIVPDSYFTTNPLLSITVNGMKKVYTMYATNNEYQYAADIKKSDIDGHNVQASLTVQTSKSIRTYPFREKYFTFTSETERIPCGIDKMKLPVIETEAKLFVYPGVIDNENHELTINYELINPGAVSLRIYSSDGKLMYQEQIPERQPGIIIRTVDVSNYFSGAYFVSVTSGVNNSMEKFIILK